MMQAISYEEGKALCESHVCGECGAPLTLPWGGAYGINGHVLRCGVNPEHTGIVPRLSLSQVYKRGGAVPQYIADHLEKKIGGRTMEEKTTALETLTDAKKDAIKRHLETTFAGSLVPTEAAKAFALVEKGFDPRFHLCLYQNKITLTIDGWYWWAAGHAAFGSVITDPIAEQQLREAYGVGDNEFGALAKLYLKGQDRPAFVGFGRASKDEKHPVIRGSFVEHQHPYRMAEKRAEAQVLRKFRPIGLEVQTPEELIQEDFIDGDARVVDDEPPTEDALVFGIDFNPEESGLQREEAIEQIKEFYERKGWLEGTCEVWLLGLVGYRTPQECPDELLEKVLRNIEAQG